MKSPPLRLRVGAVKQNSRAPWHVDWDPLSPRERVVAQLVIKGLANKQIGRELKITEGTVKTHLHRIYQKLGVMGRFALSASSGRRAEGRSGKPPKS